MEILVIEPDSPEQANEIKTFLKSMKVSFKTSNSISLKSIEIANSVAQGYQEAQSIESGQIKAKSYSSFKEMLDEL